MNSSKLRRQIAFEAAKLMYQRQVSEYHHAKMKAARRICRSWVKPDDLPSNSEIRDEIQGFARMFEGEKRFDRLREMRIEALNIMRMLMRFKPRLIGSVLTGHIRDGSDIDIHVFSDSVESITNELDYHGYRYEVQRKRVRKDGEVTTYRHVHVYDRYEFELTVYPTSKTSFVFTSSITGKPIEKKSIPQLEQFLKETYPDIDLEDAIEQTAESVDRFQLFYSLLLPLENVKQHPKYHPEGDVLYHSLQVFDLACDNLPYDEEFLLAALLHDIGKGIDADDHVNAGLDAIREFVTERTLWLIEHHMIAHKLVAQELGHRASKRLRNHQWFDDLMLLCECDQGGRQSGVETTELEDALDYVRSLADQFDY